MKNTLIVEGKEDKAFLESLLNADDLAIRETKLPSNFFPETYPYSIEKLLDYSIIPIKG